MKEYTAEPLFATQYQLAESPFWDVRYDRLSWVDIPEGKVYTLREGKISCHRFPEPIGAAVPLKARDGYLAAGKTWLWTLEEDRAEKLMSLENLYEEYRRSNDAKADPSGRVYFGSSTADDEHEPGGNLYRYDRGTVTCVQPDTRIANGMAWSADRKRFYFSDSLYHAVFVYDYDQATGDISGRRELFRVEDGVPDGLCIDDRDRLWLAVWGGSRVECRNGLTGALEAVVRVPARQTSSCCFFGKELDRLLITSAGVGLEGETEGRLYTCRVEARGLPADGAALPA